MPPAKPRTMCCVAHVRLRGKGQSVMEGLRRWQPNGRMYRRGRTRESCGGATRKAVRWVGWHRRQRGTTPERRTLLVLSLLAMALTCAAHPPPGLPPHFPFPQSLSLGTPHRFARHLPTRFLIDPSREGHQPPPLCGHSCAASLLWRQFSVSPLPEIAALPVQVPLSLTSALSYGRPLRIALVASFLFPEALPHVGRHP